MPLISVITPAHTGRGEYLREAGRSLAAQQLPEGWELEWVVQEDGPGEDMRPWVEEFDFVRYDTNGEHLGIAVTRNLALTRTKGEFLVPLDSDDLLLPQAMPTAIAAVSRYPEIHWVAAQAYDLLPDGSRVEFTPLIEPGYVAAGVVGDYWREHDHIAFHPCGLLMRTAIARAVGGWAANPRAEDCAFLLAVTELVPGYFTPEVTWLVRKHDSNTTSGALWRSKLNQVSHLMCTQRAAAIRELGLALGHPDGAAAAGRVVGRILPTQATGPSQNRVRTPLLREPH